MTLKQACETIKQLEALASTERTELMSIDGGGWCVAVVHMGVSFICYSPLQDAE